MNSNNLLLLFLFLLVLLVVLAVGLRNGARHDGLGRRPPPRSRMDDVEPRSSVLQRLA
jgi:hypothetical protein